MKSSGDTRPRVRVMPADQSLESADGLVLDVDDRLVVESELTEPERLGQLDLQRQPLGGDVEQRLVEHRDLPLALRLGVVHRDVGVAQQRLDGAARACQGDPDARRNGEADAGDVDRELQQLEHAVTDLGRLLVRRHVLEQHGELVAAQPSDGVGGSEAVADPRRDRAEQLVAGAVPHPVVHRLEVVEVDEHDRDAGNVSAFRALERVGRRGPRRAPGSRDPVSSSWKARRSSCDSSCRRLVTSRNVTTMAPMFSSASRLQPVPSTASTGAVAGSDASLERQRCAGGKRRDDCAAGRRSPVALSSTNASRSEVPRHASAGWPRSVAAAGLTKAIVPCRSSRKIASAEWWISAERRWSPRCASIRRARPSRRQRRMETSPITIVETHVAR